MIFIKFGQHVNEMMAVAVKKFQNFGSSGFLIIRQNVNMATNAILYFGLSPGLKLSRARFRSLTLSFGFAKCKNGGKASKSAFFDLTLVFVRCYCMLLCVLCRNSKGK